MVNNKVVEKRPSLLLHSLKKECRNQTHFFIAFDASPDFQKASDGSCISSEKHLCFSSVRKDTSRCSADCALDFTFLFGGNADRLIFKRSKKCYIRIP